VGGLAALIVFGPWLLTNGWFALFSGVAACPLRPDAHGARGAGWLL
jgi:hypothetical protein